MLSFAEPRFFLLFFTFSRCLPSIFDMNRNTKCKHYKFFKLIKPITFQTQYTFFSAEILFALLGFCFLDFGTSIGQEIMLGSGVPGEATPMAHRSFHHVAHLSPLCSHQSGIGEEKIAIVSFCTFHSKSKEPTESLGMHSWHMHRKGHQRRETHCHLAYICVVTSKITECLKWRGDNDDDVAKETSNGLEPLSSPSDRGI